MQNLVSPRARAGCRNPMAAYDRLPIELRQWLMHAALPWSAKSALRLWQSTLHQTGCKTAALARLTLAEHRSLTHEAGRPQASSVAKYPRG